MAQKIRKKSIKQTKKLSASPFNIYWEKKNYYMLGLGFILTIIGFYFMTQGPWDSFSSLVISPILLFIAYVIVFPLSIFLRNKSEKEKVQDNEIDSGKS
jgi:heme/copper-type cytochrome/quinol oxidase subunit 4